MSILDLLMAEETATSYLKTLEADVKTKGSGSNNVWYRYRNMEYGQSCTVRFLPMSEENVAGKFYLPKKVLRLKYDDPVNIGQDVNVTIPIMQMYVGGKPSDDPILGQAIRLYEQSDALEKKGESEKSKQVRAIASAHYIRGEAIAQGFVCTSGIVESDLPENLIRMFELNKQIIKVIESKLETDNPDLKFEYWPCHGVKGSNFIIKKTRTGDGKYAKWDDGTGFSVRTSPLTEEQQASVVKFGLWNLRDFLPARPSDDEYKVLTHMVQQSIAGNRVWDPDWDAELKAVRPYRTAQGERPDDTGSLQDQVRNAMNNLHPAASSAQDVMEQLNRTVSREGVRDVEPDDEPEVVTSPTRDSGDVQDIVNKIRSRQKTATAD